MDIFQVALELEGSGKLAVTVLADRVTVHLPVLLIELYVVLHVVHEPAGARSTDNVYNAAVLET